MPIFFHLKTKPFIIYLNVFQLWLRNRMREFTRASVRSSHICPRRHSPCCRERWSWQCRPTQHQQKAGPPQQYVWCSLHGPLGWSLGFYSAPDGCCPHPVCSRGYRDTPGTLPEPCSLWSSLHRTNLGTEGKQQHWWNSCRTIHRYRQDTLNFDFCKSKPVTSYNLPLSQTVHPLKPPLVPTTCPRLFRLTWWAW